MTDRYHPQRLDRAWQLLQQMVDDGRLPAVGAVVGSTAGLEEPRYFGRPAVHATDSIGPETIFLIASPTKPIVAMAAMMLVEQGLVRLADSVCEYLPEFAPQGKRAITLAHCLTHTSGLPDMPPNNAELRASESPLAEFYERACQLKPDFTPGHRVQYQSMGYLVLGEIVERVTGTPLPEFLRQQVFEPLGLVDTALGMPTSWDAEGGNNAQRPRSQRIAEIRLPPQADPHSACWNTRYWRRLGAPWGGLLSTPLDLAAICRHQLMILRTGTEGILSPAAVTSMTSNQLSTQSDVPEVNRRCQPWGYGWQLNWPSHGTAFSELLTQRAFGHWGATGTVVWADPERDALAVVLSTEPLTKSQRLLTRFSNAVAAALR